MHPLRQTLAICVSFSAVVLAACSSKSENAPVKPSTAELTAHETELLRLTLTTEAVQRLGIATVQAAESAIVRTISLHGEVVAPPIGGSVMVNSTSDLAALAANQARADADLARTQAELEIATRNAERAEALMREEAGSARARDEAQVALVVARSNLQAAKTQRAQLGPAIDAMNGIRALWIRVAVPASDLPSVDRQGAAHIASLGQAGETTIARPVSGPPSANAAGGTLDLYYALNDSGATFRIGQRVAIAIPVNSKSNGLAVPTSAILRDIYGGEWVYVATADRTFERRRVEIAIIEDGIALLAQGLSPGMNVVTAGAAELFGTEFGAK